MNKIWLTCLTTYALIIPAFCAASPANDEEREHQHHDQSMYYDYKDMAFSTDEPWYYWGGFYLGVNVGGKWGDYHEPITVSQVTVSGVNFGPGTVPFTTRDGAITGGIQAGYNWQFNPVVVGVEADFNGMDLNGKQTLAYTPPFPFVGGDSFTMHNRWESSIRGRAGYPYKEWLFYLTGGIIFTGVTVNSNFGQTTSGIFIFPPSSHSATRTLTGGTIGLGLEYAFLRHWSAGAEYRYATYGRANFNLGTLATTVSPTGAFVFAPVTSRVDLHTNEVLFKLNYHFN